MISSSSMLLPTTPKPLLLHRHPFSSLSLLSPSPISLSFSSSSRLLILNVPPIRMGGGPRTFPGGVTKWQWKRMQAKKSKQLLKARLLRERQIYETRKRAELKAAVSNLEKPWELVDKAPALFSVAADDQLKVLADRFQRPGGFDMWTDCDGPQVFRRPDDLPTSRFFPKGVVHSVRPYGIVKEEEKEEGIDDWIARGAGGVRRRLKRTREGTEGVRRNADEKGDGDLGCIDVEARLLDDGWSENQSFGLESLRISKREDDEVNGKDGVRSERRQRGRAHWTRNSGLHPGDGSRSEDLSLEGLRISNRERCGVKGRQDVRRNFCEGRRRGSDSWSRNIGLRSDDERGKDDSGLENLRGWKKGHGVSGGERVVHGNCSEERQKGSHRWSRNAEMHSDGGSGKLDNINGWKKERDGVNGGGQGIQRKSFGGRQRGNHMDKVRLRPTNQLHSDRRRTGVRELRTP